VGSEFFNYFAALARLQSHACEPLADEFVPIRHHAAR